MIGFIHVRDIQEETDGLVGEHDWIDSVVRWKDESDEVEDNIDLCFLDKLPLRVIHIDDAPRLSTPSEKVFFEPAFVLLFTLRLWSISNRSLFL